MVSIRIARFSELLYLTTGSSKPVPVSIPFTIKKGNNNMTYTDTAFPNQLILKPNFKRRQTKAVLIKLTEV